MLDWLLSLFSLAADHPIITGIIVLIVLVCIFSDGIHVEDSVEEYCDCNGSGGCY